MKKLKRIFEILHDKGIIFLFRTILSRIIVKRIPNLNYIKHLFISKSGLEVGGPSGVFQDAGFLPLYKIVKELDGCNFSSSTIWEGKIESGRNYTYYKNKKGFQYISEAADLSLIPDSKYDFVISSNCLEHVANPLKAVEEWIRVIKKGGLILLVLPNKHYCFDHNRQVTEFSHLLEDYQNNVNEDDLTHLDEILEFHDLEMDKPAGTLEQFKKRSVNNFDNRALHHHVFNTTVLREIFSYFKLEVLMTYEGGEFIILGKKNVV